MTDSAAVSVSGGIVLVGVPHISPLVDKAEMLLGHATGLLCTGAAFSCDCSRRNLKTSCGAVTICPWSSSSRKHSKESCRTLFLVLIAGLFLQGLMPCLSPALMAYSVTEKREA